MSIELHSRLIEKLENLIQDPYNYLYEYVIEIKTKIDLKDEQEPLKNYEELIKELDDFQSERKKVIEDNIQTIKNHYSHRIEFSKKLSQWIKAKDELFKDEIEANITSLNNSIVNLKMAIMDHEKISFNGSQIIRTPVDCEENLKNLIEPKFEYIKSEIDNLTKRENMIFSRYQEARSKLKEQFTEAGVSIGRYKRNHDFNLRNILKLEPVF